MERVAINPKGFASTGSPVTFAIKAGGMVYCSGLLPTTPETGQVATGDIRAQTKQVLRNLEHVLKAAGSSLDRTVKVTVYMTDLSGFSAMNEVYREFFPTDPPARSTVGISGLVRPGCLIEIDLIAVA